MFSLNATLPVFLVMVIGWALGQKGFLPKQFCTVADKLVFKVTLPVMLFCDMATLDLAHSFDAKFVLFCFAVTAIAIVVIWVLARRLLKDKTLVGEFVQASCVAATTLFSALSLTFWIFVLRSGGYIA